MNKSMMIAAALMFASSASAQFVPAYPKGCEGGERKVAMILRSIMSGEEKAADWHEALTYAADVCKIDIGSVGTSVFPKAEDVVRDPFKGRFFDSNRTRKAHPELSW